MAWVKEYYADAAWLPVIVAAQMQGDEVWVDTRLRPGDAVGAKPVCAAFSAFLVKHGGFTGVRVAAGTGDRIVWRRALQDPC
jgi:hypothetical protein